MKYNNSNKPLICMMTQSTCYKNTKKMSVKGVLWHSTGANNPNIKRYVQPDDNASNKNELIKIIGKNANGNDWNHVTRQAGVNAFVGKLADGSVSSVQVLPWDYRPWGCGSGPKGSCNDGWIQFEICEDNLENKDYFNKVYKEACELTAYLCKMYKINPKDTTKLNGVNVPTILCHADSHELGLGSNHGDVLYWFNKYGKTMNDVRKDVYAIMNGTSPSPTKTKAKAVYTSHIDDGKKSRWLGEITNYNTKNGDGYSGVYGKPIDCFMVKATGVKNASVEYKCHTYKGKWYDPVTKYDKNDFYNGYAGVEGKDIDAIAIKATGVNGKLKYRVHTLNGQWLPWVTGYNSNDNSNGYAGNIGTKIDGIQITIE